YSELISYMGAVIVFLGVTMLFFYYQSFGINIVSYLEFSEIITSFFHILVIAVIFFLYSTIQSILQTGKSEHERKKQLKQDILNEESFFKRLWLYLKFHDYVLFSFFAYLLIHITVWIILKKIYFQDFILLIAIYIGGFLLYVIASEVEVKHNQLKSSENTKRISELLLTATFFVILTIWVTYQEVHSVKKNKTTYGTTVILKDESMFKSDSCNYFIGKTQNYVFFYNEESKSTEVIPVSELKRMILNSNRKSDFQLLSKKQ
ncbi:MAG: hypothetical protein PHU98_11970, partial [Mariniphaga sp.]|nr:hypothetical protein [Mariniphaga sp.]